MDYQEAIETIQYASAFNSENSRLTKALDVAISAMQELQALHNQGISLERLKDIDFRKEVVEHINYDAYMSLMDELEEYRQLGTLEEVREAVEKFGQNAGEWIPASQPPNNIDEHQYSEDVIVKLKWYDGDISYSVGWYSKKYGWSENCDNCEVIEWTSIPNKKEDSTMRIKIKYHTNITPLGYIGGSNSDWIDLRAAEDVFIPQGEYRLISLGVSMQLPDGYEAHVVPRSSTFKNYGIIQTNHMGIIDNSYCGDNDIWHFPALCLIGKDIVNGSVGTMIHKNDRICQFRIMKKQPEVAFLQVDKLGNSDRGGIGSTGRR